MTDIFLYWLKIRLLICAQQMTNVWCSGKAWLRSVHLWLYYFSNMISYLDWWKLIHWEFQDKKKEDLIFIFISFEISERTSISTDYTCEWVVSSLFSPRLIVNEFERYDLSIIKLNNSTSKQTKRIIPWSKSWNFSNTWDNSIFSIISFIKRS